MKRIILAMFELIALMIVCTGCGNRQKDQSNGNGYYISTQTQTDDRVKKLDMDKPSEDVSYILDYKKLTIPKIQHSEPHAGRGNAKTGATDEFNQDALIQLKCDTPFEGKLVWDVLQSVGLRWGDGDLFHWGNPKYDYGDDQLFSVWTTTDPGYFLPESIKAGKMSPSDLLFGFSIPRNADPKNVFDIMITAVKYCQKRLGGRLVDKDQQPFDEQKAKKDLALLITKMNRKGIVPGSDAALEIY